MSSCVFSQVVPVLRLDAKELLLVVPLVQRSCLVETLVALEAHQGSAGRARDRLGQLGLADAGRTLDEQRLLEGAGEVGGGRGGDIGQVARFRQPPCRVVG